MAPSLPSSLPSSSPVSSLPASSIPPAQKMPETPISWSVQKKSPEDYSKQRAKYAKFFVGKPYFAHIRGWLRWSSRKIISFIITDLKTRRLAGIKKETFEELLKTAGIPAKVFLQKELRNLGCPAADGRPCKETGRGVIYHLNITGSNRNTNGHRKIRVTECAMSPSN